MTTTAEPSMLSESSVSRRRLEELTRRIEASGTDEIAVVAPATDESLGSIPNCREEDLDAATRRARRAQSEWADRSVERRAAVVDRFGTLVRDRREELLDVVQLETGKARSTAVTEVLDVAENCSYYADLGPSAVADQRRDPAVPVATTAEVTYDPVGVVGVISPWNYPLTLSVADAIPALVAGCSVVLKPDEKTPYTALLLAELLDAAGLPDGVFQVVTGEGATVGPAVVDRVDYVAFTGSSGTGRAVAERAGRNLIDCSLELGGKNPMVVLGDADPGRTARGAVDACFTNAGQLCLSAERLYVVESVYEEFLDAFVGEARSLSLGCDLDYRADVGSLIGADQLRRVRTHVQEARETGGSVLTGGRHRPDVGPYVYEPTILTDVDPETTVACEETFGPVVSVTPVPDADAAVEAANDSPYGLNGSVWTGDRERGRSVARRIDCGTVCVNDGYAAGWAAFDAPSGGVGDSGVGYRHGPEGIERYLQARTVATSRVGPLGLPRGGLTRWAVEATFALTGLRRRLRRWWR